MNDGLDKNTKTILAFELQELGYSKDEINRIIEEQQKAYIERKIDDRDDKGHKNLIISNILSINPIK